MSTRTDVPAVLHGRRDWGAAMTAVRRLLADADDTTQVFRIMRALNADMARRNYTRLLKSSDGGRIAYEHVELADRLSDPAYVAQFRFGTVGAAYAAFLRRTGYSAQGLADVSRADGDDLEAQHPYFWFGRRLRDTHDIWHVLTGYQADEPLGEACLVAFSYAQTGGLGWALIALAAAAKSLTLAGGRAATIAIWEGYRRGKAAKWLPGEDMDRLLAEPIDVARTRLGISPAPRYDRARGVAAGW